MPIALVAKDAGTVDDGDEIVKKRHVDGDEAIYSGFGQLNECAYILKIFPMGL
jgi:hypothetical protein